MDYTSSKPRIIQGANGSFLLNRNPNLRDNECKADMLNIIRNSAVENLHRKYIDAGANILITNTFLSSPLYSQDWRKLIAGGLEAAIEARKKTGRSDVEIAFAISPIPNNISAIEARRIYTAQIAAAARFSPDTLLFETFPTPEAALEAVIAASEFPEMKVWVSFSPTKFKFEQMKEGIKHLSEQWNVDYFGLNCMLPISEAIKGAEILSSVTTQPLRIRPAACIPGTGKIRAEKGAKILADTFRNNPRIDAIGYCCGSDPVYVSRLANEIKYSSHKKTRYYHA